MNYLNLALFSLIVGLLGIFYRNILKEKNMILAPLFSVLDKMVSRGGFLKWLAYPLGYCIYCSTTWIAIIGFIIVYRVIALEVLIPIAISHLVVDVYCKYVLGDIYRKRFALYRELLLEAKAEKKGFAAGGIIHKESEEMVIPKPNYKSDSTQRADPKEKRSFLSRELAAKRDIEKRLIEAECEIARAKFEERAGKLKEAAKRSPKIDTTHQDFVNSLPDECYFFSRLGYLTEHYFPVFIPFIKYVRDDKPESGGITKGQLLAYAIDADFRAHMEGAKI